MWAVGFENPHAMDDEPADLSDRLAEAERVTNEVYNRVHPLVRQYLEDHNDRVTKQVRLSRGPSPTRRPKRPPSSE